MPLWGRKDLGDAGEALACRHLKKAGYRILERNFNSPAGEIDIICMGQGTIAFVEVKTRAEDLHAAPENNINAGKQRRIERAARTWLAHHGHPEAAYRFDAVSIVMPPDGKPVVRHIMDAFRASRG